ncbi:phenylalanine--tRNA ligase subunit beta [Halobacterium noricense]|uniref:phenylalanine--tRNA ligase subunit beta n=1 Tax=Halobacterium noricense TaxID=223182 RepID=UPI001E5CA57B|nr:phenylalanine--tRNA ligase subunit beta [Halobacterium noricense]UHH25304.1 phenylalanine--tRNA ligase subunit beta [Halobacterium noricense]
MPVVDIDPDELRTLTGHTEKSDDDLKDDLFGLGIEYEGETDEGEFKLEFEADRLDRLSVEGIARSLRYHYGDTRGVYVPDTNSAEWTIHVEDVPDERPCVTGAVVRGVDLDEDALDSLIQLQEKLHATMGRKRAKGAIGIHDLAMLKGQVARSATERASDVSGSEATGGSEELRSSDETASESISGEDGQGERSITYTGIEPDGDTFVPLDDDAERTPADVLTEHPTGEQYADLLENYDRYPAIYDDIGMFSFPPVINGRRTEVSTDSRELFVELTGTDQWTIDRMCAIICYALDARGATVEDVTVEYADTELVRPDFEVQTKQVPHEHVETLLGIDFEPDEVVDLAERAGLDAEPEGGDELTYEVEIPPYRVDVLHPVDVVDDIGRAYGFNNLVPRYPDVGTIGGRTETSRLEAAARETLVGLGFEDLLNFNMTNEADNFERMRIAPEDDVVGAAEPATIDEPYSEDFTILRTWALPSLVSVLENNTHRSYPQDLAEIGFAAHVDDATETGVAERRTVAAVLARHDASYEDAKARLAALCEEFHVDLETPATDHPSFIDGRAASVVIDGEDVGVIGELHPAVVVDHDVEVPVAGFEFALDALR